jgi:hypothetical protein
MSSKKKDLNKKSRKKALRKAIEQDLFAAAENWEDLIGKKKLKRGIRKATEIFVKNLKLEKRKEKKENNARNILATSKAVPEIESSVN